MYKINSFKEIDSIIVKVLYINVKNELTKLGNHNVQLSKKGVFTAPEQVALLKHVKQSRLPTKYICTCVLDNKIAHPAFKAFNFNSIEMSLSELEMFERNDNKASLISSFEHKQLKAIYFNPCPLLLSDLNEVVVVLREVSSTQIQTRKNTLLSKKKKANYTRRVTSKPI